MSAIGIQDVLGFAAGASTLFAFAQKASVRMRLAAATSNLCFIAYGGAWAFGALYPPLILNSILLPLNVAQLVKEMRSRPRDRHATLRPPHDRP
jgi:hypothetical protein